MAGSGTTASGFLSVDGFSFAAFWMLELSLWLLSHRSPTLINAGSNTSIRRFVVACSTLTV